jgi:hypothetical protein
MALITALVHCGSVALAACIGSKLETGVRRTRSSVAGEGLGGAARGWRGFEELDGAGKDGLRAFAGGEMAAAGDGEKG